MATHPVLLPRKFNGWRSLVGYSPRGHKESDMTWATSLWCHFVHTTTRYRDEISNHCSKTSWVRKTSERERESHSVMSDSLWLHGLQSMEFFRPEYWSEQPFPSLEDLPNPGIEPRSPALQADSSPAEPQRKSKNTGVGSLPFLQQIFPTQESNRGLLHCRQFFTNWAIREAWEKLWGVV